MNWWGKDWEGWFGWVGRGIMDRYGGLEGMGSMRIGFSSVGTAYILHYKS